MNIKRIQILSDAENDLDEGRKFYDKQGENVGNYFWASPLSDIESLVIFAGIHKKGLGFIGCYRSVSRTQFIMMSMAMLPPSLPCYQYEKTQCG